MDREKFEYRPEEALGSTLDGCTAVYNITRGLNDWLATLV